MSVNDRMTAMTKAEIRDWEKAFGLQVKGKEPKGDHSDKNSEKKCALVTQKMA